MKPLSLVFTIIFLAYPSLGKPHYKPDGRIIGGRNATIEQFPYQIAVEFEGIFACGGSLISNKYVITGAHCTHGYDHKKFNVRIGSNVTENGGIFIKAIKIFDHPLFDFIKRDYDISIFELEKEITFNTEASVIDLPSRNQTVDDGTLCNATGWGYMDENSMDLAPILQAVTLPIVNHNKCASLYTAPREVTERMICAGYLNGGKDACVGDSGGPLVSNGILVGVVSWGVGCGRASSPGVYTSVSYMREFIFNVTGI